MLHYIPMKIVVTSKNPVKLAAAQRAFATYFADKTLEFITESTDSGVSEQPMSAEETAHGAINRTRSAQTKDADFIVGIEGGLSFVTIDGTEYGFEQTWACVRDGRTGLDEIASGPTYPMFPRVLKRIHAGQNLTDAMASEYGTKDLGKNDGYNGWLSRNEIDRANSSYQAVFLALCALLKEEKQP